MSFDDAFLIAALGSSAGGLQALIDFFEAVDALDDAPNAAFIVLPHLPPDEKSRIAELLQRHTRLEVHEVGEPMRLSPGCVYVLPADRSLTIVEDRVEPRPRSDDVPPHPVDDLFLALGPRFGQRAIGIVLSGTGRNGSFGISAIKEHGGLAFAQEPDEAEFSDMPRSAIETGLVDKVLPVERMPAAVASYADHLRRVDAIDLSAPGEDAGLKAEAPHDVEKERREAFQAILTLLRTHAGLDLRQYKTGTLLRRIDRRVALHRLPDWSSYAKMLRDWEDERDALVSDLLITVTAFFRDEAAWDGLRETVIRPLVEQQGDDEPLRAWVAGCATGEEAYSLAILLFEEMAAQNRSIPLEIFATDASRTVLSRARHGRYPAAAIQHLSDRRRERFFRREDDTVRVRHDVREAVVFAPQNLVQDPPFSRVQLVVCRNVLIYLKPELQQKVVQLFRFALSEGGFLFLGPAENIGTGNELFETVSNQYRIYRRTSGTRREALDFPLMQGAHRLPKQFQDAPHGEEVLPLGRSGSSHRTAELLADMFAPPSILCENDLTALYYHGATSRYLKPQLGEPTQDLAVLLREGLSLRVRRLAEQVRESGTPQAGTARVVVDDGTVRVRIEVTPVRGPAGNDRLLITFHEETDAVPAAPGEEASATTRERELEAEVAQLRDDLRRTLQASTRNQEELKSYNEEVMSMNEELRSANEELETSKEELQSLNEELNTVNSQLRAKVDELHERTGDLNNLLASTDLATLFLDADFHIRWFSPAVAELFSLREQDTGRPISDLKARVEDVDFLPDAREVLRRLVPVERTVKADGGHWYQRRIVPYRTLDDRIDGVVVTFADVTAIQDARDYAEKIVETVPLPFLVLDEWLRVKSANPAFYDTFRVAPEETDGRLIYDLGNGQWNIPELRSFLTDILPSDQQFKNYEVTHVFETVGEKTMKLNGRRLDHVQLILLAIEDVTEERRAEAQVRLSEGRLRALVNATSYAVYRMSPDWSELWELDGRGFINDTRAPRSDWMEDYIHPDDREHVAERIREAVREGSVFELEHRVLRPDGTLAWTASRAVPLFDEEGRVREWFGAASDVTERKQAEADRELVLRELDHRVKNILAVIRGLATLSDDPGSVREYRQRFVARLDALIRAHNLALGREWRGTDLALLARTCLEAYQGTEREHVFIEGESVQLDARKTMSIALVLHELATNAVKHGSLSAETGCVRLSWAVSCLPGERRVRLEWREMNGPHADPPEKTSFGLRMIERLFEFDLRGEADLDFRPEGLVMTAAFPL